MDYREALEDLADLSRQGDAAAGAVLQKELTAPLNRMAMRQARIEAERLRRVNERRHAGRSVRSDDSFVHFNESDWLMKRLIRELCRKAAASPKCDSFPDPHRETVRIY